MIESVIHLRYGQVVCQINYITLITGKYKVSISSCVNFFFFHLMTRKGTSELSKVKVNVYFSTWGYWSVYYGMGCLGR